MDGDGGASAPPFAVIIGAVERRTVWLVGMMGSGKTTVGRALARRLALPFVDTDAEIERDAGMSVARIFSLEGEAGFRRRERDAIGAVAGRAAVVSLGGGAIAQPGSADRLAATGTIVYLRARPRTLLGRLGAAESRPLLRGLDETERLAKIESLLAERSAQYERAEVVIDTDGSTPAALAAMLAGRLAGGRG